MTDNKGKIHIYCGDGKGKTTAAIGLAVRAAGSGGRVVVLEFLKDGSSSELNILRGLDNITVIEGDTCGLFAFQMNEEQKAATLALHKQLLARAISIPCDMLVLDELCGAMSEGLIDEATIKTTLESIKKETELVITGRNPAAFILEQADYVTEMRKQKHPYDKGEQAREGIEY